MNRRNFAKMLSGSLAVVAFMGSTVACTGSVFTNILNYVGVGLTAFSGVLAIISPFVPIGGMLLLIVNAAKAGFADLQVAVTDYNNAPAADKTTLLGKISVVLNDLVAELQTFWSNLNIPNPIIALVAEGILKLIIGILQGFIGALPPIPATPKMLEAHQLPKQIVAPAIKMSAKEFKVAVNKILADNGQKTIF